MNYVLDDHFVLIDLLNDSFLNKLVQIPTRTDIKTGKGNILDLVLSSHPDFVDKLVVGEVLSDHCLLTFTILEATDYLKKNHTKFTCTTKAITTV